MDVAKELGHAIDSGVIQRGLKELNKDFSFDVAVNRPGDWEQVIQFPSKEALEAARKNRLPVMYYDRYITALDRGIVPEFKQWSVKEQIVELPWSDADKEWASICYETVQPWHQGYSDLYTLATLGSDPSLVIMPNGSLVKCVVRGYAKVRGKVLQLGWRHTFEKIIHSQIPGVTREEIGKKFGVDMYRFPMGSPDQLVAALVEE